MIEYIKRLSLLLICCLFLYGCAIIEQSIDEAPEKPLPAKPVLYSSVDSIAVFKAKSAIQRSPEYILSAYVVVKDGACHLDISKEEREMLGISEMDYQKFLKELSCISLKH